MARRWDYNRPDPRPTARKSQSRSAGKRHSAVLAISLLRRKSGKRPKLFRSHPASDNQEPQRLIAGVMV